jgi:hypothetical protein
MINKMAANYSACYSKYIEAGTKKCEAIALYNILLCGHYYLAKVTAPSGLDKTTGLD